METSYKYGSLLENFYKWEKQTPNNIFLKQPYGNTWKKYSWKEAGIQVRKMAAALLAMNLPKGSNIGIISKNCAHWIINDMAISMAGHVSVPFYPTLVAGQLKQVLDHSQCKVLFVGKLDDFSIMEAGISDNIKVIAYPAEYQNSPVHKYEDWDSFCEPYKPLEDSPLPNLDSLFTIIYTSGTTGMPKGVMTTHRAIASCLDKTGHLIKAEHKSARFFSYLPLCHIAERNIIEAASLITGGTVHFAENLDTFAKNLADAQPTHFLAVPRIWSKFQLGILGKMPQEKLDKLLKIPIIGSLVKWKIKKGLGLNKAEVIITGAAPMPVSLLEWFRRLDIHIREAYGMTENVGCHTVAPLEGNRDGTVGKLHPGVECRIDKITKEVQMKAPWNTPGYYREPELTAGLIRDGWLCTGDMGELSDDNFLKITGRVKDQFKTSKGEYVVPGTIEFGFADSTAIEQICVAGAGLPQPVALVVLSEIGKSLTKQDLKINLTQKAEQVNQTIKNYEHIKRILVVKQSWTVENNMLTPTMKIKRNVIEENYSTLMEKSCDAPSFVVFEEDLK